MILDQDITTIHERFKHKIRLLILDNDDDVRKSLTELFSSKLFSIDCVASLDDSIKAIGSYPEKYYCWILDIDLGEQLSGLMLLDRFPQYDYAVVLSGLRSMSTASVAMLKGARSVVDKSPDSIQHLCRDVFSTAAIGHLLQGKHCPDLHVFLLLRDESIQTIENWAEKAHVPLRKLHRICETYPPLTPRYCLEMYRALVAVMKLDTFFSIETLSDSECDAIAFIARKYG